MGGKVNKPFKELKSHLQQELIFKIYVLSLLIIVKTDILNFVMGAYLIQKYLDG